MGTTKRLTVPLYTVHRDAPPTLECDSRDTGQPNPAMLNVTDARVLVMETSRLTVPTSMIALPLPLTGPGKSTDHGVDVVC